MRPRRTLGRQRDDTSTSHRRLLIACEGEATEYRYFHAARIALAASKEAIQIWHPNATDPRSIVQSALDRVNEHQARGAWDREDQAWAVFDGDEHRDHDPVNWNDALQIAGGIADKRAPRVHLAISNPCFELWYLLHFQAQHGYLHRDTARGHLRRHLADYEKADVLWTRLRPMLDDAHGRAEVLAARSTEEGRAAFVNPSTSVHLLVKRLLDS